MGIKNHTVFDFIPLPFFRSRRIVKLPITKGGFLMNLTISGHHLEVTPALRSYVTDKLDRITRHFDQVVDVKVLLSIENQTEEEVAKRPSATSTSKATTCSLRAPTTHLRRLWTTWSTN
jgi:ribosomal subunit interface protein